VAFRKHTGAHSDSPAAQASVSAPTADPKLRDEVDPDPMIEEMVERLRENLSSLVAVDEWGRPLAWRNVVRLALGPVAARMRDTETVAALATALAMPEAAAAEIPAAEMPVAEAPAVEPTPEPQPEAAPEPVLAAVPAASAESMVEEPVAAVAAVPVEQPSIMGSLTPLSPSAAGAASIFVQSADQASVPVRPLGSGELGRGSSADHSTTAKYDRFLTGLHGEGQQVRAHQHGSAGGTGLGDHGQGRINS
jgi:hypothetical protein